MSFNQRIYCLFFNKDKGFIMEHHFDIDLAKKLNVNCAIIYKNLEFWCSKNKANSKNFIDGNYWTYNSVKAWKELFPYLGETQIKNALKTLEEDEYIMSGEHNANKYDRTKWYCIIELEVLTNGDVENSQPIPYNKPDKKTYNNDFDSFLEDIRELVSIKSKVTATKEGKSLFKNIQDKEQLKADYIKHQKDKGEFSKRITAFMLDYELYKNSDIKKPKRFV